MRYPVTLSIPSFGIEPISLHKAVSMDLMTFGIVAIIGRDLLASFRLTYNGPMGRIEVAV